MDNRLLFAVARGARVQVQLGPDRGWINSTQLSWHDDCVYRIHPDQLEYQYGPISTALREQAAEYPEIKSHPYNSAAIVDWATDYDLDLPITNRNIPLFLLILAEALADSGL